MRFLRQWSFARVVLVSIGWVALCALLAVAWFRAAMAWSGSGGIGFVVVDLNLLTLAVPFAPPLALVVTWLMSRRR